MAPPAALGTAKSAILAAAAAVKVAAELAVKAVFMHALPFVFSLAVTLLQEIQAQRRLTAGGPASPPEAEAEAEAEAPPRVALLSKQDPLFREIYDQFYKRWQPGNWNAASTDIPPPQVKAIYRVLADRPDYDELQGQWADKRGWGPHAGLGNELRRFHGTSLKCSFSGQPCDDEECNVCGILKQGRLLRSRCRSVNESRFGDNAMYFTSNAHVAKGYGGKQRGGGDTGFHDEDNGNAVFVFKVLCGTAEKITGVRASLKPGVDEDACGLKEGCDSKVVIKTTGNDELVVYQEEQAAPLALLIFGKDGEPRPAAWGDQYDAAATWAERL